MEGSKVTQIRFPFGQITIGTSKNKLLPTFRNPARLIPVNQSVVVWRPNCQHLDFQVPPWFRLSLNCYRGEDGHRRFVLAEKFENFIAHAWMGGLAILARNTNMTCEERERHRAAFFLWQYVRHTQEHLSRSFRCLRDLRIRGRGRDSEHETTVLPASIGSNADGTGCQWTPERLVKEGEAEAQSLGLGNVDLAERIQFGLLRAARLDPLQISQQEVPSLVNHSLFDVVLDEATDPSLVERVRDRALDAIRLHLDPCEDADKFSTWLFGPGNSLVAQIAKRRKAPGGELERDQVRAALVELGWQAYRSIGQCIGAQMELILHGIPDLTRREQELFAEMILPRPYFANLPFMLMAERRSILKHAVLKIWAAPQKPRPVQVVHRLLQYYAIMVDARRRADRRGKPRHDESSQARGESVEAAPSSEPPITERQLGRFANHLRKRRGVRCSCRVGNWALEMKGPSRRFVEVKCKRCAFSHETEITSEDLQRFDLC